MGLTKHVSHPAESGAVALVGRFLKIEKIHQLLPTLVLYVYFMQSPKRQRHNFAIYAPFRAPTNPVGCHTAIE